jgi:hypothetical protein
MFEIFDLDPDAMTAELAYRRARLIGSPAARPAPRGRWLRHRAPRSS